MKINIANRITWIIKLHTPSWELVTLCAISIASLDEIWSIYYDWKKSFVAHILFQALYDFKEIIFKL